MADTADHLAVLGIRHHGPGSTRSLLRRLGEWQPDCLLIEGPPEADALLGLAADEGMQPPVALLAYCPEEPQRCAFYPFAEFSPEWQAIRFALAQGIPVRFMDLPQAHQLATEDETEAPAAGEAQPSADEPETEVDGPMPDAADPLGWLGRMAGYGDGELWWEQVIEQRLDTSDAFAAIRDAMQCLREQFPRPPDSARERREQRREAHMRQCIRAALKDGSQRLAVVCGAWHAPALTAKVAIKDDRELLRALPKVKVEVTWVPWTFGRLTTASGYGAGIASPGWYQHLWSARQALEGGGDVSRVTASWLTQVARLLREADIDCSSAHVIEAVRLAEALAALRQRPLPSLTEVNEAALAIMCMGEPAPLALIHRRLIVGERLGAVPASAPTVPLQRDLQQEAKSLRLKLEADERVLDLDLRTPAGLGRSHLLHRLNLLDVSWGKLRQEGGGHRGTFHELWQLQWQPEFAVKLIEAAIWGNTVLAAATHRVCAKAEHVGLPQLAAMLDAILLANLPAAVKPVTGRLADAAATTGDAGELMAALPPLANVLRYSNVRQTDSATIAPVVDGLVTRSCIGLVAACASLDDDAAAIMRDRLDTCDRALRLLQHEAHTALWHDALKRLARCESVNGLVTGCACRLLLDAGAVDGDFAALQMSRALSRGNAPAAAAAWLDGFLSGSGLVLLHSDCIWDVLDGWVSDLGEEAFAAALPLVRRTFAAFTPADRQQMGQRVKAGAQRPTGTFVTDFDLTQAVKVLPVVCQHLGLEKPDA